MNLSVRAVLVDHQDRPASGVEVELCTFDMRGRPQRAAAARSNARGNLSFRARLDDVSIQPRLMLRTRVSNRFVELADAPVDFSGATADFRMVALPAPEQTGSAQALRELMHARKRAQELLNRGQFPGADDSRENLDPEVRGEIERPLLDRIEALERERDDAKKEVERRDAELEALRKAADQPGSLGDLILSSQLELQQASEKIRQSGDAYSLDRVSVTAKMIPNEDGTGFRFPTADELKNHPGPFNEIRYDFVPTRSGEE